MLIYFLYTNVNLFLFKNNKNIIFYSARHAPQFYNVTIDVVGVLTRHHVVCTYIVTWRTHVLVHMCVHVSVISGLSIFSKYIINPLNTPYLYTWFAPLFLSWGTIFLFILHKWRGKTRSVQLTRKDTI